MSEILGYTLGGLGLLGAAVIYVAWIRSILRIDRNLAEIRRLRKAQRGSK